MRVQVTIPIYDGFKPDGSYLQQPSEPELLQLTLESYGASRVKLVLPDKTVVIVNPQDLAKASEKCS